MLHVSKRDQEKSTAVVRSWVDSLATRLGSEFAVPKLNEDQHKCIDPMAELAEKGPTMSLKIRVSGAALDTLAVAASLNGEDLETALRKAIALYVESSTAVRAGKGVGIADDPETLTTQFTGLVPNFP